jgi:hypothetical protein
MMCGYSVQKISQGVLGEKEEYYFSWKDYSIMLLYEGKHSFLRMHSIGM